MAFPSPVSPSYLLEDGGAAVTADRAGRVGGVARIFDCGAGALFDGYLILDISAINTTGDRTYNIKLQASNSATFASGVIDLNAPPLLMGGTGQSAVIVTNRVVDTNYRYLRLYIDVGGTSPSVTLEAWLIHTDSLAGMTLPDLASLLALTANRFANATQEYRAWSAGVVGGGPNSDGDYPLSDGFGNTYLVPCPAKIAATTGLSHAAIDALTPRTAPFAYDAAGPVIPFNDGANIRKGNLFMFASRRTADLQEVTVGAEAIDYHVQVLNTSTGESRRASLGALLAITSGVIDVTKPPYNCRFDGTFTRNVITTAGSDIIEFTEPGIAARAKVGHAIQLSNAFGGNPGRRTVTELIDAFHIRMSGNATTNFGTNDCLFGTDNTAGLQAALYEARARSTYTYGGHVQLPTGIGLTGALVYYPRTSLAGWGVRQTILMRLDDGALAPAWYEYWQEFGTSGISNEDHPSFVPTQPAPLLRAKSMYADFPAMCDFSIHGARYCQSLAYPGLSMHSHVFGTPGPDLPQVDSYPMFSRMHVIQAGWNGWEHTGSHSGSMFAVEIINCGGVGYHMAGYDANITNILCIGNEMTGMYFQSMAANSNLLNVKLSFNGVGGGWLYGHRAYVNLAIDGAGNNITNMRIQESKGSSLWLRGTGNQLADVTIDDTGCIVPEHRPWDTGDLPVVRAAIILDGCNDNRFNDVIFGGAVHYPDNYATHAIFCINNPQNNSGRIVSKGITKFDDAAYFDNGETSGPYMSRAVGTHDAGGIHASNRLTLDEELLSEYYP